MSKRHWFELNKPPPIWRIKSFNFVNGLISEISFEMKNLKSCIQLACFSDIENWTCMLEKPYGDTSLRFIGVYKYFLLSVTSMNYAFNILTVLK